MEEIFACRVALKGVGNGNCGGPRPVATVPDPSHQHFVQSNQGEVNAPLCKVIPRRRTVYYQMEPMGLERARNGGNGRKSKRRKKNI